MKPRQPPKRREGAKSGRTFWEMRTITLVIINRLFSNRRGGFDLRLLKMSDDIAALYGYAFGDETGDAGFNLSRGSSSFFVGSLVLTNQPNDLREYVLSFQQELRLKVGGEISFHRSPDNNRIAFLSGLLAYDVELRALAVNKRALATDIRRLSRTDFYVWAFGDLLAHTLHELDKATIVLDEFTHSDRTARDIQRLLKNIFSDATVRQHIRRIHVRRSQSEPLLQIADMMSGAIYRHVAENDSRFYQIIESRSEILEM